VSTGTELLQKLMETALALIVSGDRQTKKAAVDAVAEQGKLATGNVA